MTTTIVTSTSSTATAYSNQRKVDRTSNGVLWALNITGGTNTIQAHYSTDNGSTWTLASSGPVMTSATLTYTPNFSFFIDVDDYAHVVFKDQSNGYIYYTRGTPNAGRTAWTWSAPTLVLANTTGNYPDIVAHREGTGWTAHIVASSPSSNGSSYASYWHIPISSSGTVGVIAGGDIRQYTSSNFQTYPSIDFHHTGDGKTVAGGTPHLYVAWSAGSTGSGYGIRFEKATYSGGTWTWGTEREIDPNVYIDGTLNWLNCLFDGTRVVMVGDVWSSAATHRLIAHERDEADTTTTTRLLQDNPATTAQYLYGSATYDADSNLYIFGDANSTARDPAYAKWTRSGNSLSARNSIGGTGVSYFSAKRGYSNNEVEYVYTDGTASPYSVTYGQVTLVQNLTSSSSDGAAVSVAESSSLLKQFSASDTSSISVSEVSSKFENLPGSDGSAFSVSETSSVTVVVTPKSGSDAGSIKTTETSSVVTALTSYDAGSIGVAESRAMLATKTSSDAGTISIAESSIVAGVLSSSDSSTISVAESATLQDFVLPATSTYQAIANKPVGYWQLDGSLSDYSGYNQSASTVGSPGKGVALANGCNYSTILDRSNTAKFPSPVFQQGKEDKPFTLEAWARAIQKTSGIDTEVTNLVTNPSFESNLTGWGDANGATNSRDTTEHYVGSASLKVTFPTYSGQTGANIALTLAAQTTYTLSAWVYTPTANAVPNVWLQAWGAGMSTAVTKSNTPTLDAWTRYTMTFTTGPGGSTNLLIGVNKSTAGQIFYVDAVMLTLGTGLVDYFDGDTVGARWDGTPNNSTSTMLVSVDEQQILGNSGQMDGLTINGTEVSFVTKYTTNGESRVTYDLQIPRRFHAVGVHTESKNQLYIDGTLVGEVDISDVQQADTFVASDGYLYTGDTASSMNLAVNGVGIYANALSPDSIARNFKIGNTHVSAGAVAAVHGGIRIPLSATEGDLALSRTWETEDDWNTGLPTGISVVDDQLVPWLEAGTSIAGTWQTAIPLDTSGTTSLYGVNMTWDGAGAIVEASVDGGTTWETVTRGVNLANIASGTDPTGMVLEIQVSFPGGIADDPSYLASLTVNAFAESTVNLIANRVISFTAPGHMRHDHEPAELSDDWGLHLESGTLTISSDTSSAPMNPQTVEVWLKRTTAANATFSANLSGAATFYSNGVSGTGYPDGEWVVRHFVMSAPTTADITIGGNVQIGQVVLYTGALTAEQIYAIYNSYVGLPSVAIADESTIGITKPAASSTIYAYDWAITASG